MASLISYGTGAGESSDIVIADGSSIIVALEGASTSTTGEIPSGAFVKVQIKNSAAKYVTIDQLSTQRRALQLLGPATYKVVRVANDVAVGVFSA